MSFRKASEKSRVTVIIPTLCEASRADLINRAISSVHQSASAPVRILVIVNGQRYEPTLLEELMGRDDIDVIQLEEGSLTLAHKVGRQCVGTEYFSYLDDDDEYLPDAVDIRVRLLDTYPSVDLVVTNGYTCRNGVDSKLYTRILHVAESPLDELFSENWLHNCNSMFRTKSVSQGYFEDSHQYMEWTWLAFRLAMDKKLIVGSDELTFRYHDTPGSLSKSVLHSRSRVALYRKMLKMKPPPNVKKVIKKKMVAAWHEISEKELKGNRRLLAVAAHMRSLISHKSGLQYLAYTRHLFKVLINR